MCFSTLIVFETLKQSFILQQLTENALESYLKKIFQENNDQ